MLFAGVVLLILSVGRMMTAPDDVIMDEMPWIGGSIFVSIVLIISGWGG